ncbi:hypothetical protein YN1HA_26460 [Sulfurisphaera ohwakuensis]
MFLVLGDGLSNVISKYNTIGKLLHFYVTLKAHKKDPLIN